MKKINIFSILILSLLAFSASAQTCSISNDSLNFGQYDPLSPTDTDSTFNIQISCTGLASNTSYSITLDGGTAGGGPNFRRMTNATYNLNYNIYTDATFSTIWGDPFLLQGSAISGTAIAPSDTKTHTGYGRIPTGQPVRYGAYSDNITITLTY